MVTVVAKEEVRSKLNREGEGEGKGKKRLTYFGNLLYVYGDEVKLTKCLEKVFYLILIELLGTGQSRSSSRQGGSAIHLCFAHSVAKYSEISINYKLIF